MKRIFLIGYMGSGKTTMGRMIAEKLNLQFIDLDIYIERRFFKTISTLFAEKGETEFREIERRMLNEVADFEDVLIATGGGTPCFFNNMEVMNQKGTTVYLKTPVEILANTLKDARQNRPLLREKTVEELTQYIAENLEKREPFYSQAQKIVLSDGSVEGLERELLKALEDE